MSLRSWEGVSDVCVCVCVCVCVLSLLQAVILKLDCPSEPLMLMFSQSCTTVTPWTAACQASLSFTISLNLLKLRSIELVMPSNHFILCCPFSCCLQSFLASGSVMMSWLFTSGGQSIGALASASVLPMNI